MSAERTILRNEREPVRRDLLIQFVGACACAFFGVIACAGPSRGSAGLAVMRESRVASHRHQAISRYAGETRAFRMTTREVRTRRCHIEGCEGVSLYPAGLAYAGSGLQVRPVLELALEGLAYACAVGTER